MREIKLTFEKGISGRHCHLLLDCDMPIHKIGIGREEKLNLPKLPGDEINRHYTGLIGRVRGVNDGFYPLRSCTMKYNPKVSEEAASLEGSMGVHPLRLEHAVQGALRVFGLAERYLCEIIGMETMTFQLTTGAHGEFTGLLLMKAYHHSRRDEKRTKIIVPDSAHGTNPVSAAMADYNVVSIPSRGDEYVDLGKLKETVGEDTVGLILTDPNTVGLSDRNILEITYIVHEVGGLCYYDRASLNAVVGIARPGDTGFDVIHLNLHKTFSTPHGGGGPGSDLMSCKKFLRPFLPESMVKAPGEEEGYGVLSFMRESESIGRVKMLYGNFGMVVKALSYIVTLGREGVPEASFNAVLNANYMMNKLSGLYEVAYNETCMYEFVMTLEDLKYDINMSITDIAKTFLDYGVHPSTMHFPLIVHEVLIVGSTGTESRETLGQTIEVSRDIYKTAKTGPESPHQAPVKTAVRWLDEATTARRPVLCYTGG